jgi:hypothetical protein
MIEAIELVMRILGPVVARMVEAALNGNDPRSVLLDARVSEILPAQSATEKAMLAARKAASP